MVVRTNRVIDYLNENHVEYELIPHRIDFSAQRTAADTHTPGREFAKPVVLEVNDSYAMAVLPAPHKVDLIKLRDLLDAEVKLASEETTARLFPDCEVGAEPPFGNLYDMPTYVSPDIAEDEHITFNGGTHHEAIRIRYADYEHLVKPRILDLAWHA